MSSYNAYPCSCSASLTSPFSTRKSLQLCMDTNLKPGELVPPLHASVTAWTCAGFSCSSLAAAAPADHEAGCIQCQKIIDVDHVHNESRPDPVSNRGSDSKSHVVPESKEKCRLFP